MHFDEIVVKQWDHGNSWVGIAKSLDDWADPNYCSVPFQTLV